MPGPSRGEVWMVDLNPVIGREQAGTRPAVVLSVDAFNAGPADLVIVAPVTGRQKNIPTHVRVDPPEGGLDLVSFVKTEDIRSVSKARLRRCLGSVEQATMGQIEDRVRMLLNL